MEKNVRFNAQRLADQPSAIRVAIAAIGTGGHIYPGLEIAEELKKRGSDVRFIGTPDRMEKDIVPARGYPFHAVSTQSFAGKSTWGKIKSLVSLPVSIWKCYAILKENKTQAVIGTGAYGSVPVVLAARLRGIPVVLYEPNGFPGTATRVLMHVAQKIFTPFEAFVGNFPESKRELAAVIRKNGTALDAIAEEKKGFRVYVFGGSQGSMAVNAAVLDALPHIDPDVELVHMTGTEHFKQVSAGYQNNGKYPRHTVVPYIDDVAHAYSNADLIVMRGGATTLAEIAAHRHNGTQGRAVIAIPYEGSGGQQTTSAMLAAKGALIRIPQAELTGKRLADEINALAANPEKRKELSKNLAEQVPETDGAEKIAQAALHMAKTKESKEK